jgi:hypothetical protein
LTFCHLFADKLRHKVPFAGQPVIKYGQKRSPSALISLY